MAEGLPEVNLLPKYERESSIKYLLFIIFIVLMLIFHLFIGIYYFITKSNLEAVKDEYTQLNEQLNILTAELKQLEDGGNSSLGQAVTIVEQHEIPTSNFITELDSLLPNNGYLSEYEYENGDTKVVAHFETLDTVANYTTELTTSDYITDTKVDEVETFMLKDEEADEDIEQFDLIPRYEANFSLIVNKQQLKGESSEDE